jgi:hypothetical protein
MNTYVKKEKPVSKNKTKLLDKIKKHLEYIKERDEARKDKISVDRKGYANRIVLTRKIARNIAKNNGLNFNELWKGKPNYDKKEVQKLRDMQWNDKKGARLAKLVKEKRNSRGRIK